MRYFLIFFLVLFQNLAFCYDYPSVPTKSIGDSLTNTEFNEILESVIYGTKAINPENVNSSGTVSTNILRAVDLRKLGLEIFVGNEYGTNSAALASAISAYTGAQSVEFIIDEAITNTINITIPSNIKISVKNGGSISNNATWQSNGLLELTNNSIFYNTGTLTVSANISFSDNSWIDNSGNVSINYPESIQAPIRANVLKGSGDYSFIYSGAIEVHWFYSGVGYWTNAINNALSALPNTDWDGCSGGRAVAYGGRLHFPTGIYEIDNYIDLPSFITIQGDKRHSTIIRQMAVTINIPVIKGTDSRFFVIKDVTLECNSGPLAGQNAISLIRTASYGVRFFIERVFIFNTYNGIDWSGNTTGSLINDVRIRAVKNDGIHWANGSVSSTTFNDIYISVQGRYGIYAEEAGAGNCVFNIIIVESGGSDGLRAEGIFARNTFSSCYFGDLTPTYCVYLVGAHSNTFNACFFNGRSAISAILLDGCAGNSFNNSVVSGGFSHYLVEQINVSSNLKAYYLNQPNYISYTMDGRGPDLGITNSPNNLSLVGERLLIDNDVSNINLYLHTEGKNVGKYSYTSSDANNGSGIDFATPNLQEKWSYIREFPGTDNNAWFARVNNTIGSFPVIYEYESNIVTGDSVDFTTTTGNWEALTSEISIVTGGVSGNCLKVMSNSGATSNVAAKLELSAVTANKLYEVSIYSKNVSQSTYVRVFASDDHTVVRTAITRSNAAWLKGVTYFTTTTDTAYLYVYLSESALASGNYILIDNIEVREVSNDASLSLSGGRKYGGQSEGGGGGITLYSGEHTTTPGVVVVTGDPATDQDTVMYLMVNDGGVYSIRKVTMGADDSGAAGYKYLRVPN